MKKYKTTDNLKELKEPEIEYLIRRTHEGLPYHKFLQYKENVPFTQHEWSSLLQLSERTFQRYKKDEKTFEPLYTEKILEVVLLFSRGVEVLGSETAFYEWLRTPCLAFGNAEPFSIIDNSFGIDAVKSELARLEQGVFS